MPPFETRIFSPKVKNAAGYPPGLVTPSSADGAPFTEDRIRKMFTKVTTATFTKDPQV